MSEPATTEAPSSLDTAWRRFGELRDAAERAERVDYRLLLGFIGVAFLAAILAVFAVRTHGEGAPSVAEVELEISLILAAALLAWIIRERGRENQLLLRAGAAEIESCIYFFLTVLQGHDGRERWLADRVRAIRQRVFEQLGREPAPAPEIGLDSPGPREDMLDEEYLQLRLNRQIARQAEAAGRLRRLGRTLWITTVVGAGAGVVPAVLGGGATALAELAMAAAIVLFATTLLRRVGSEAERRRKASFALGQLRDAWLGLGPTERNGNRFMRLVSETEWILTNVSSDAPASRGLSAESIGGGGDLLERVLQLPAPAALDEALEQRAGTVETESADGGEEPPAAADEASERSAEAEAGDEMPLDDEAADTPAVPEATGPDGGSAGSRPHAFVVMPFGRKRSLEGDWIDFDRVYQVLIQPALVEAGFEPFRADEESVSGDILTDMFQELLLADLVVADLSIDNANVFYELGVRHAVRKRGVVHIQSGRSQMPFDVFNVRTVPYHLDASGKPEPEHVAKDRQALVKVARETWASDTDRIHSPVFNLLDGLTEPDRRALCTPLASGHWRAHDEWRQRVAIARRRKRVGDLLLLTEEVRSTILQEEAISEVGVALRSLGLDELALAQYRRGCRLNPRNSFFRRQEAVHLGRLKRYDDAVVKLRQLLREDPEDTAAQFRLGEIYESAWQEEFMRIRDAGERRKEAYEASVWAKKAIESFLAAYRLDQNHSWSGIKALIVSWLLDHLGRELGVADDRGLEAIRRELGPLSGAVRFTLESQVQRFEGGFDAQVKLGYLAICEADEPKSVQAAFRKAVSMAGGNAFYLRFTLEHLKLFEALAFRPELTRAAVAVIRKELRSRGRRTARPKRVFLFQGHAIDRPEDAEPRFPAAMEEQVAEKLEETLTLLKAGNRDLAITAGASSGGEILFLEACLRRGMKVEVYLPYEEARFVEGSVSYAGREWTERFYRLRKHPDVRIFLQKDRVGPPPAGVDPYERSNRWAVYSALIYGIDRVRCILLWDGRIGDAESGAGEMFRLVRSHGGAIEHLDTSKLDYWRTAAGIGAPEPAAEEPAANRSKPVPAAR